MITDKYEDTYISVKKACEDVKNLDDVILVLEDATAPMSCREIGLKVWGPAYLNNRRLSSKMGQILKHLRWSGDLRIEKIAGEPVEIEYEEYQRECDDEGNPRFIKVHDDEGNTYDMPNPKYRGYRCGRWIKVKRTVIPTTKVYSLVAR